MVSLLEDEWMNAKSYVQIHIHRFECVIQFEFVFANMKHRTNRLNVLMYGWWAAYHFRQCLGKRPYGKCALTKRTLLKTLRGLSLSEFSKRVKLLSGIGMKARIIWWAIKLRRMYYYALLLSTTSDGKLRKKNRNSFKHFNRIWNECILNNRERKYQATENNKNDPAIIWKDLKNDSFKKTTLNNRKCHCFCVSVFVNCVSVWWVCLMISWNTNKYIYKDRFSSEIIITILSIDCRLPNAV